MDFQQIISFIEPYLVYDNKAPLLFNSGLFLVLFVAFYGLYIATQRHQTFRVVYVTLFSLFFYYKCSGWAVVLLLVSSVWDYFLGLALHDDEGAPPKSDAKRKFYLWCSIVGNLGLLAYFKYTNFFIDTVNDVAGRDVFAMQNIVLPAGISFYTFQTMSYSIDIYRRNLAPTRNFIDFLFFVSFFPQLVAGPIVRAVDFMSQIRAKLTLTREELGWAFYLIVVGLIKKAVISDYISINFVDRVFEDPLAYSGTENLLAVYGYCIQIYCDFSGYSDMAIGLALLMGFKLPPNFDAPYISMSITEFWRRWHLSLSTWLRDYLYISLGGNRHGKIRTYINLLLTMLLGGLWHGANWKFVVWGALHGGALAIERAFKPLTQRLPNNIFIKIIAWFYAFHFVAFCWIFFRATNFEQAYQVIGQIATGIHWTHALQVLAGYQNVFALIGLGFVAHFVPRVGKEFLQRTFIQSPAVLQSLVLAVAMWWVIQTSNSQVQAFIYFQF